MRVADLKCESRTQPLDIDTARPGLSWVLSSDIRGDKQTAYRIRAARTLAALFADKGDLWDSGRIDSSDTLQVEYAGTALNSWDICYWQVQVWDRNNTPSDWSQPAHFGVACLLPKDWQGEWITNQEQWLPLFRRQFPVPKLIDRATIYVCGLGQFDLFCNGQRVGSDVLQPGWTNYHNTCLYTAFDLKPHLTIGENVIGVILGNGMYHVGDAPAGTKRYTKFKGSFGRPQVTAHVVIDYADGTRGSFGTDANWLTAPGPLTYSNIYGGEDHDGRAESPGWAEPTFNAHTWDTPIYTDEPPPGIDVHPPAGELRGSSSAAPPVSITRVFEAQLITTLSPTRIVFDAGQNCSMMPGVSVRGPAGSVVKLSPAESLKEDGGVNQKHTGNPVFYQYTLRGDGEETWSPRFAYTGGRYIQVDLAPPAHNPDAGLPTLVAVRSHHITSAGTPTGHFECSNDLFNRTAGLIDLAIRSNTVSIFTDCPHREKLGWLEQQHLVGPSLMYRYDLHAHFRKATSDHTDAQLDNGDVPTICPQYTKFKPPWDVFNDSPEWGSSAVLVPWQVYKWYGDGALLKRQWPTMKRYVDYLTSRATNHIVSHGLGDWYDLGPNPPGFTQLTPKELTATAIYFHDCEVLAKVAGLLGLPDDAAHYSALAGRVRTAFNRTFYDGGTHQYATKSQTSLAMPLALGLVLEEDRAAVLENLVADIRSRDNQLTSGDVGYRYLLRALAQAGRHDVIFDMNSRSDRPGYGMMLARGETSLTEAWDARPQSSLNHFMLGHIQEWLYADLAGLAQADDSVAFNRIVIRPNPVGDITHASATYTSARGEIRVAWAIDGGAFVLDCAIPPNTTAVVHFPAVATPNLREGGTPIAAATNLRLVANTICEIEAGSYRFTADLSTN